MDLYGTIMAFVIRLVLSVCVCVCVRKYGFEQVARAAKRFSHFFAEEEFAPVVQNGRRD